MISSFTKDDFEAALPVEGSDRTPCGVKLWEPLGLIGGEYCYLVPVAKKPAFAIMIRSSVHADGQSADVGEDSIRCWITSTEHALGTPWGSKISAYVTRVPGWEKRLTATLRQLYKMALSIEKCQCGEWMKVFKVKKRGPNHGRIFLKCMNQCRDGMKFVEIT